MPLSRYWTSEDFFAKAALAVKADLSNFPLYEKHELVNQAIGSVIGQFYGLMQADYRRSEEVVVMNDAIDLSSLKIMRTGNAVRITVEAGTTASAGVPEPVSTEERLSFRPGAAQNAGRIVYEYAGEQILLKKATGVATYNNADGKVIVHYPGIPEPVGRDSDFLDLPDGSAIEIAMLRLQKILSERLNLPQKTNYKAEMESAIRGLYGTYQAEVSTEEVKAKIEALS